MLFLQLLQLSFLRLHLLQQQQTNVDTDKGYVQRLCHTTWAPCSADEPQYQAHHVTEPRLVSDGIHTRAVHTLLCKLARQGQSRACAAAHSNHHAAIHCKAQDTGSMLLACKGAGHW